MAAEIPPARVLLIGYGLGGAVFHAPLIATTPGLELAAVVTSDQDRRAAAHRRYPSAELLGPDEWLGPAREFDLAVVTTPNATHVALAEATLRSGLSVVVDKPVAPSAAEARRLAGLATGVGRTVMPFHNRRWDGDFRTVSRLAGEGRLGRIWRFESRFERWQPDPSSGRRASWKGDPAPEAAGGVLYDLGPHLIDQALALFGRPAAVYAELDVRRQGVEVDDDAFVALSYPDGLRAHLWMSATAARLGPRFRVLGSAAGYVKHGLDGQEDALKAGRLPDQLDWGREPPDAWGELGTEDDRAPLETLPGAYPEYYAAVAACLRQGAPPPVAMDDAIAGLEVIEAARRSARRGSVEALPS